jgi:hypothetical protein
VVANVVMSVEFLHKTVKPLRNKLWYTVQKINLYQWSMELGVSSIAVLF